MGARVVRHLPNLTVADQCAVEQAARNFEVHPDRKAEAAAYVARWNDELRAERGIPTVEAMRVHVQLLADAHGVAVEFGGRDSTRRDEWVRTAVVRSESTYAQALHAIGLRVTARANVPRLEGEANAWAWAIERALPGTVNIVFVQLVKTKLTKLLKWVVRRKGYIPGVAIYGPDGARITDAAALRRHFAGRPRAPELDHVFWQLLRTGSLQGSAK